MIGPGHRRVTSKRILTCSVARRVNLISRQRTGTRIRRSCGVKIQKVLAAYNEQQKCLNFFPISIFVYRIFPIFVNNLSV